MTKKELWVASYSHAQKCFHCETVDEYLSHTLSDFFKGKSQTTYNMIGLFNTYNECQSHIRKLKAMREKETNF
jgi:hypothetical protein